MTPPRAVGRRRPASALRPLARPRTSCDQPGVSPARSLLLDAWGRRPQSSVMIGLHTALLPAKQDTMARQDFPDFRTNHQLLRFREFELERLACIGSGNRVEIAGVRDEAILATSARSEHARIIAQ